MSKERRAIIDDLRHRAEQLVAAFESARGLLDLGTLEDIATASTVIDLAAGAAVILASKAVRLADADDEAKTVDVERPVEVAS